MCEKTIQEKTMQVPKFTMDNEGKRIYSVHRRISNTECLHKREVIHILKLIINLIMLFTTKG